MDALFLRNVDRQLSGKGDPMPASQEVEILRSASYLPVPDVTTIGAYYRDVLGFQCEGSAGEPPEFAIYSRGKATVMLRHVANAALITPNEAQGGTWDLFCWVNDADALFEQLTGNGAEVVYGPVVQPYRVKEFAVRDPVGHVLGFGQDWPADRNG
jgi:uncharacterized glyoxalase superfamily protein PhnB